MQKTHTVSPYTEETEQRKTAVTRTAIIKLRTEEKANDSLGRHLSVCVSVCILVTVQIFSVRANDSPLLCH